MVEPTEEERVSDWFGPFYAVPMPVDAEGRGPCNLDDAVKVHHEVWDGANRTVAECSSPEAAVELANRLTKAEAPAQLSPEDWDLLRHARSWQVDLEALGVEQTDIDREAAAFLDRLLAD